MVLVAQQSSLSPVARSSVLSADCASACRRLCMDTPASLPLARPGPLTAAERFCWDCAGFLVVEDALTEQEVESCLAASKRIHGNLELMRQLTAEQQGAHEAEQLPVTAEELDFDWRQVGNAYEHEPAFRCLIDHKSVFPKARALFGGHLILQGSWLTKVPPGWPWHGRGAGLHQDGGLVHTMFKPPAPLMQLRVAYHPKHDTHTPHSTEMSVVSPVGWHGLLARQLTQKMTGLARQVCPDRPVRP